MTHRVLHPRDLYVCRHALPPHRAAALRAELLAVLDAAMCDPQNSEADRLALLGAAVVPLAQIFLGAGTHPDCVVQHAAEFLEANYLALALVETPRLAVMFDDT